MRRDQELISEAMSPPGRESAAFLEVMREPPYRGQEEAKVGWRGLDRPRQELRVVLNPNKERMI
jgi:hypothetical protein